MGDKVYVNIVILNILAVMFLCVLFPPPVCSVEYPGTLKLYSDNATGASPTSYDNSSSQWKDWSCDVLVSDNTTTTVKVRLEGNMGGATYSPIGLCEHTLSATEVSAYVGTFSCLGLPVRNIRANLVTNSTAANYVTVRCIGVK